MESSNYAGEGKARRGQQMVASDEDLWNLVRPSTPALLTRALVTGPMHGASVDGGLAGPWGCGLAIQKVPKAVGVGLGLEASFRYRPLRPGGGGIMV